MSFEVEPYTWQTGTRPCTFTLALGEGSVFADFDVDPDGFVSLLRVSFDGYGAWRPVEGQSTTIMDKGFDTDRSFMLIEIAGEEMYFQTISRAGVTVDSGSFLRPSTR